MKTIIFAGPSISHQQLAGMTTADIAPPIRRGDIDQFSEHDLFVILDGEFGQNLSVSPKEILSLLNARKIVIGASSMGALRASELDTCGMIGVGWVYEHFTSAAFRRDDDVALAYSPLDLSPITVPTIDVEYWTALLFERNLISTKEKKIICQTTRKIFYAERTEGKLMRELERVIGSNRLKHLLTYTSGAIPNIKYLDAIQAVELQESACKLLTSAEQESKGDLKWNPQNILRTMA